MRALHGFQSVYHLFSPPPMRIFSIAVIQWENVFGISFCVPFGIDSWEFFKCGDLSAFQRRERAKREILLPALPASFGVVRFNSADKFFDVARQVPLLQKTDFLAISLNRNINCADISPDF